jgi:hypothetical protein
MLLTQYAHRLPADYGMERIRQRAATRGPEWDSYPGVAFKAFLVRERGIHNASGNVYSSLYLWKEAGALSSFLTSDGFRNVIATFGRPEIETWFVLDSAFKQAASPRLVQKTEEILAPGTDLTELAKHETRQNRNRIEDRGIFAAISAIDTRAWRIARFILSGGEPYSRQGIVYEVAYFARPGLSQ